MGSVVSYSNALEACLRVATNPAGALDELSEWPDEELDEDKYGEDDDEDEEDGD